MSVSATAYELSEGKNHTYPVYFHCLSGECIYQVFSEHLLIELSCMWHNCHILCEILLNTRS